MLPGRGSGPVVMTLLVRDEVDIVAAQLDYHLANGVDQYIVTDNASRDGTRELLAEYQRTHPLVVLDEPGRDYDQAAWVTRMLRLAKQRFGASWVLNSDADEFWRAESGDLAESLAKAEAPILEVRRCNLFAAAEDLALDDPWSRTVHRVSEPIAFERPSDPLRDPLPAPFLYLDLPPKVMAKAHSLRAVRQGNHAVARRGFARRARCSDVVIHHFPVRSREGFLRKVEQGGRAYERNTQVPETAGWHWRRWYRMLREDGPGRVLGDVVPSRSRLHDDLQAGLVVEDRRLHEDLRALQELSVEPRS